MLTISSFPQLRSGKVFLFNGFSHCEMTTTEKYILCVCGIVEAHNAIKTQSHKFNQKRTNCKTNQCFIGTHKFEAAKLYIKRKRDGKYRLSYQYFPALNQALSMYISAIAAKLAIISPTSTPAITLVNVLFFFIIHSVPPLARDFLKTVSPQAFS